MLKNNTMLQKSNNDTFCKDSFSIFPHPHDGKVGGEDNFDLRGGVGEVVVPSREAVDPSIHAVVLHDLEVHDVLGDHDDLVVLHARTVRRNHVSAAPHEARLDPAASILAAEACAYLEDLAVRLDSGRPIRAEAALAGACLEVRRDPCFPAEEAAVDWAVDVRPAGLAVEVAVVLLGVEQAAAAGLGDLILAACLWAVHRQ